MFSDYGSYGKKYSRLVEMEREEEMKRHTTEMENMSPEERQSKGRAVLDLKGKDDGRGFRGEHMVEFKIKEGLPDNEIFVGDLVMVSKEDPLDSNNPTGTVTKSTDYSITVSFPGKPPEFVFEGGVRIDLYVNDVTFQRMLKAIDSFQVVVGREMYKRGIILGNMEPRFEEIEEFEVKNDKLDESQKKAAKRSLEAKDLMLIHGPPGTGKTTALIEAIEQHVERKKKVLATADSNVAVDNMVDFLVNRGVKAVRIGHPVRVTESIREHTLDHMVQENKDHQKAQELWERSDELSDEQEDYTFPSGKWRRGMDNKKIKKLADKGKGSKGVPPDRIKSMAMWIKLQEEKKRVINTAKKLEDKAVEKILKDSEVVCTTNSTAGSELMDGRDFDVLFIDEATQATEPSCLIPIAKAEKTVMAGDHKQLPPTIISQEASEGGLGDTLFERMLESHGDGIKEMLEKQYRMNTDIMNFSSQEFYDGELEADESVADHTLDVSGKPSGKHMESIFDPDNVVLFLDSHGKWSESRRTGSKSIENEKEAAQVKKIVDEAIDLGVSPEDIGVISPYDDQVELLKDMLDTEGLEIKTVDGFQGRQKDVIVVSFVRSNEQGNIGFLEDLRRLNVSITRARKKLIMVGDSETLKHNETYSRLIDYVDEKGSLIKL